MLKAWRRPIGASMTNFVVTVGERELRAPEVVTASSLHVVRVRYLVEDGREFPSLGQHAAVDKDRDDGHDQAATTGGVGVPLLLE